MPTAEIEALDAMRFQKFIRRTQFPHDCRAQPGVLTRAGVQSDGKHFPGDYFYGLGLGSQMASLPEKELKKMLKDMELPVTGTVAHLHPRSLHRLEHGPRQRSHRTSSLPTTAAHAQTAAAAHAPFHVGALRA